MQSKIIKVLRWVPFVVVGVELILLLSGVLTLAQATLIIATVEIALVFMLVIEFAALRAGFRRARRAGGSRSQAMSAALEYALPKPVAGMILQEFRVFGALFSVFRRNHDRPDPGYSETISYRRGLRTLVVVLIAVSAVLGLVAALFIPIPWLRWLLVALAAYWVLASVGYGSLMRINPHLAGPREIRLRLGKTVDVGVPAVGIDDVRLEAHTGERKSYVVSDDTLVVAVMGKTNVAVRLNEPVVLEPKRVSVFEDATDTPDVVRYVRFFADDPQQAVTALRALA